MKIILKQDVQGLGYKDDVVEVKNGYARNYLLPQGYAILATPSAVKALNEELKQRAHKIAKIKADAEAEAKKFEGVSLQIEAKVSDGQNIYGSVGVPQIIEALQQKGLEIEAKKVILRAVKTLGNHEATLQFHKEVSIILPFEVIPDAESVKAAEKLRADRKAEAEAKAAKEAEAVAEEEAEEVTEETPTEA
ncbi:MAG: 50S ribosomal protein L9 [Prevotellaceae bacterium]|nr:50S ribosomal protein L9 [Candidatus Colivivens equi]